MNVTQEKIRELIESLLMDDDVRLVDVELRGQKGSQVLRVFADTMEGITMAQVTRLTREISDALDMQDIIQGKYRLEVSSPGATRPLKQLWEFEKNVGRNLKVVYEIDSEIDQFIGELREVDEENILLRDIKNKKNEMQIPLIAIKTAQIQLKW